MLQYLLSLLPKSQKGQDLAEYALLIGLIALVVVIAVTALGTDINAVFERISTAVSGWAVAGGGTGT